MLPQISTKRALQQEASTSLNTTIQSVKGGYVPNKKAQNMTPIQLIQKEKDLYPLVFANPDLQPPYNRKHIGKFSPQRSNKELLQNKTDSQVLQQREFYQMRPPFGPISPKSYDPMKFVSSLTSPNAAKQESSPQPSLKLKIKSSLAFLHQDQLELQDIMKQVKELSNQKKQEDNFKKLLEVNTEAAKPRSRSTMQTQHQFKPSKIERLGLCDPDGTNFRNERKKQSLSSVNSYKYLQYQFKDIKLRTDEKRDFLKTFAKKQLRANSIIGTQSYMPDSQQENYKQMLRIFDRPKKSDLPSETISLIAKKRLKNKSVMTGYSNKTLDSEPNITGQEQLKLVKQCLVDFINENIEKAAVLQPHMNFDPDDYSKKNISNLLQISNNKKDQVVESPKKTEKEYIMQSFSQLDNTRIASLCDILLEVKKEENILKKIEKEMMQAQIQNALKSEGSKDYLKKLSIGLGLESRINSGLDLGKMGKQISMSIKSQPNNLSLNNSNSKNNFKMKIDTFNDKIKIKKVEFEKKQMTLGSSIENLMIEIKEKEQANAQPMNKNPFQRMNSIQQFNDVVIPEEHSETNELNENSAPIIHEESLQQDTELASPYIRLIQSPKNFTNLTSAQRIRSTDKLDISSQSGELTLQHSHQLLIQPVEKQYNTLLWIPEGSHRCNLEDDFDEILNKGYYANIEEVYEYLHKIRRAITPIFSGDTSYEKSNKESIQILFGATGRDKTFQKAVKQSYYQEVAEQYKINQTIDNEIKKQNSVEFAKKKKGIDVIGIIQSQFQKGITQMLNMSQKMLQRIIQQNQIPIEKEFYNKIFKKQASMVLKSPYQNNYEEHNQNMMSQNIIPILITSQKSRQGGIASARTQLACCFALNKFWFFAGNAAKPMSDLRSLELGTQAWSHVNKNSKNQKLKERYAHSMNSFMSRYIFIYGGASQFFKATRRKETLDDLWVYDCMNTQRRWVQFKTAFASEKSEVWEDEMRDQIMNEAMVDKSPSQEIPAHDLPTSRMAHGAAIYGGCLIVHGGYTGQKDKVLECFGLFDIALGKWIKFKQPKLNKKDAYICARYNHSMTVVQDPHIPFETRKTRLMWIQDPWQMVQASNADETMSSVSEYHTVAKIAPKYGAMSGIWVFGGINSLKKPMNDIYLIQPHYARNIKYITKNTGTFKKQAKLGKVVATICFKVTEIKAVAGKAPCPRHSHAATFIKKYLAIHGGRNDEIYNHQIHNIGLNDIHLFDIMTLTWLPVAIFNEVPSSRWSHIMCAEDHNQDYEGNKIIIFGGVNMSSMCDSCLYELNFNEQNIVHFIQRGEFLSEKVKWVKEQFRGTPVITGGHQHD